MQLVEEGIASARAGRIRELTDADWENLRQIARNAAAGSQPTKEPRTEQAVAAGACGRHFTYCVRGSLRRRQIQPLFFAKSVMNFASVSTPSSGIAL
jgi:hypothetical protein